MKTASFAFAFLASFCCFEVEGLGYVETITLSNACYESEYVLPEDRPVVFQALSGTTNSFRRIVGKKCPLLVIGGKGTVVVKGNDNLIKVSTLSVGDCSLMLKSTGASKDKFKVIETKCEFAQDSGSLTYEMSADCKAEVRVIQSKCIRLQNGRFNINAPSKGSEIFSADDSIVIDGGDFKLVSDDDCFSAMNNITVNGGYIHATSLSDDVFDSNGDIVINDGTIFAFATAKGHEGFDVDPMKTASGNRPHQLTVNGGTIIATGGKKSEWPSNIVAAPGIKVSARTKLDASEYSGKRFSVSIGADRPIGVKLPHFPDDKCSILCITGCPTGEAGR